MSTFEDVWMDMFNKETVTLQEARNGFTSAMQASEDTMKVVDYLLKWLNRNDRIDLKDFIDTVSYIYDRESIVTNFRTQMLVLSTFIKDIIDNSPFIDHNESRPFLGRCKFYVTPSNSPPSLVDIVYTDIKGNISTLSVRYKGGYYEFSFSIFTTTKIAIRDLLYSFVSSVVYGCILKEYTYNRYEDIWDEEMGFVDIVSPDKALDGFTNAILHHKDYKKGHEKSAYLLILWLQEKIDNELLISRDRYINMWRNLQYRRPISKEIPYLINVIKLIRKILDCKGFVNSYDCYSLPKCYYCVNKEYYSAVEFNYTDESGMTYSVRIDLVGNEFRTDRNVQIFSENICDLTKIIKLTLSKNTEPCIPEKYKSSANLYMIGASGAKIAIKDICEASRLFSAGRDYFPKCNRLRSITGKHGTIMYASWNDKDFSVPWFRREEVNEKYAENYKKGNMKDIDEVSILKAEMLEYIGRRFEDKTKTFVSKLGEVFISTYTGSLLPYLIYLVYGKRIGVVEVNSHDTITISGYGRSKNRIYEKYSIESANIKNIQMLLNQFQTIQKDDVLFNLLSKIYHSEAEGYLGRPEKKEVKVKVIKDIASRYTLIE